MSGVVLDKHDATGNSNAANILRFRNFLKLDDISGITINSIRSTNVMYVSSNTECTQFDVDFTLALNVNVHIKILYPRIALFSNEIVDVSKLRINITNEELKREITSCTNYLQRQRNANLALSILKKCAALVTERKLIVDMLMLHCEGSVTSEAHEDGGIVIKCKDRSTQFKFFESLWRINFDCSNHYVIDFIDFSITMQDRAFYKAGMAAMNMLIKPNVPYKKKVDLWSNVIQAVNISIQEETPFVRTWESRDFLSVRSIQEINSTTCEKYEILESDDEDCIVIEDN